MHVRNYSERTQKTYLGAVAKFAAFFHTPPDKLGPPEILTYQLHLRDDRHVSFSFFNQVMSALRLFYGEVLERQEMIERIPFMHREVSRHRGPAQGGAPTAARPPSAAIATAATPVVSNTSSGTPAATVIPPVAGGQVRERWLDSRRDEVLDVPYFHVVFTIP
jgi:hypothetical protein